MTHLLVLSLLVPGLLVVAWLVWFAALLIEDTAHRMRGDVRCTAACPCRGNRPIEG